MAHPYARDFPPRRQTPPDCARRQLQQRPLVPDAGQAGHRQAPTREVEAQKAAAWRFGTAQAVGMHFFWGHKGHGTCPPQKSGGIKSEDTNKKIMAGLLYAFSKKGRVDSSLPHGRETCVASAWASGGSLGSLRKQPPDGHLAWGTRFEWSLFDPKGSEPW